MQTIAERVQTFFQHHKDILGQSYPGLNSQRLIAELLIFCQQQFTAAQVQVLDSLTIHFSTWQRWEQALLKGVPLAHLHGEANFIGMELWSNSSTLIPRPETELLVEMAADFVKSKIKMDPLGKRRIRIIDVGTGTGAILIGLAHLIATPMELTGVDISAAALGLAKSNVHKLEFIIGNAHQWNWTLGDRLSENSGPFDLIISNPPYIKQSCKGSIHPQVAEFEPSRALFLPDAEYQQWFRILLGQAFDRLEFGGAFMMEGDENNWPELMGIAENQHWAKVQLRKDLSGRDRFLILMK